MADEQFISSGSLATRLGVSTAAVKKWAREGTLPGGIMVEGSGRRVWRLSEVPILEARVRERMAGRRDRRAA